MNTWQAMVHEFHEATNSNIGTDPELRDNELRAKLIMEEAVETVAAMGYWAEARISDANEPFIIAEFKKRFSEPNFPEVIDGLCDLIYVALGTAVTAGIDLDPFFREVQRANMEKLTGPKRADGKQLKPEGWRPPDIEGVLIRARENAEWISEQMKLPRKGRVQTLEERAS